MDPISTSLLIPYSAAHLAGSNILNRNPNGIQVFPFTPFTGPSWKLSKRKKAFRSTQKWKFGNITRSLSDIL